MEAISKSQEAILNELQEAPLAFNDLKKKLKIESNRLSYHIKILKKENLIEISEKKYSLTKKAEHIIPLISIIARREKPVISVVAVGLIDSDHIFLQKKPRAPDKNKLIFFGGKCKHNLSLEDSAKKYIFEQAKVEIKNLKLKAINEYLTKDKESIIDHWIVFFYTAVPIQNPKHIKKKITLLKPEELYGDNFELLQTISEKTPKVRKIVKSI
jgi:ADP-ribose pyrophosphatase YjhB (NUDIX family)